MARINFAITLTFNVLNIFVSTSCSAKEKKPTEFEAWVVAKEAANPKREYIIEFLERVNSLQPAADRELTLSPGDTRSHR